MLRWLTWWLTFSLALASEPPFWKSKAKVYERVQDGEVIVSVHADNVAPLKPRYFLHAGGGAQVAAPCAFVFATAQKYDQLPRASSYIKRAKYAPESRVLDMDMAAFGHTTNLHVELKPSAPDSEPLQLDYKIVGGPMVGFSGKIDFVKLSERKCEVGFIGEYKYDQFPIPRFFLEFGMEVVLQRMAARMRAFTEEELNHASTK